MQNRPKQKIIAFSRGQADSDRSCRWPLSVLDLDMEVTSGLNPVLPQELEREIFEYAYHLSENLSQDTLNLMFVARRVHDWWDVLAYSMDWTLILVFWRVAAIIFCNAQLLLKEDPSVLIQGAIFKPSSIEYFGKYIRHLIIRGYEKSTNLIRTLLLHSPNIIDLALFAFHKISEFVDILEANHVRLRSLSTNLFSLDETHLTSSVFSTLTHLDMIHIRTPEEEIDKWNILILLPRLTHLIINEKVDGTTLLTLLQRCQALQILIYARPDAESLGLVIKDHRLVLLRVIRFVLEERVNGVRGLENIYSAAEYISRAKKGIFYFSFLRWVLNAPISSGL